jgi:hypothetical protein
VEGHEAELVEQEKVDTQLEHARTPESASRD